MNVDEMAKASFVWFWIFHELESLNVLATKWRMITIRHATPNTDHFCCFVMGLPRRRATTSGIEVKTAAATNIPHAYPNS